MMDGGGQEEFSVIPNSVVVGILDEDRPEVLRIVASAYRRFLAGGVCNPRSSWLSFPQRPGCRIIALPAAVDDDTLQVAGIKWIASFPRNTAAGIPRASAVIILNSLELGRPFACIEGAAISAARTGAAAAIGASCISWKSREVGCLGVIGAGLIARNVVDYLHADGWNIGDLCVFDTSPGAGERFATALRASYRGRPLIANSAEEAVRRSDLILFATTAQEPYLHSPLTFSHCPRVLNISLRDIGPDVIIGAYNIVDDIEHCLTANTSTHLAELKFGHRRFVNANVYELLQEPRHFPTDKPVIYSPFGLGILDVTLALHVFRRAREQGSLRRVADFFSREALRV
jgi:2,3-diaminopropionate biosynthesis protein SbnB